MIFAKLNVSTKIVAFQIKQVSKPSQASIANGITFQGNINKKFMI